jgi:elongator complex protein 3
MNKQEYFDEIISILKRKKLSKERLSKLKVNLCRKYKITEIPTDIQILLNAEPSDLSRIKLVTKPTRSISGVAVCTIMTKPIKCPHGKCMPCPGGPLSFFGHIPQSYTGKEPATRRAIRNRFDPYLQVFNRLEQYVVAGHVPEKIELIIMGGTFPSFPKKYQRRFITYALKAMNDFSKLFFRNDKLDILKFKKFFELPGDIEDEKRTKRIHNKLLKIKKATNLGKEQNRNEKSKIKCVGMTIETRPDYGKLKQGNNMLKLGATRVEVGIQTVYDDVLKRMERGHTVKDSIDSIRILKDLGFKLNFHIMLGLPGVSRKRDLAGLKQLFQDDNFRPDMLKLYPCMVLRGTKLYNLYKKGKYKPLNTRQAASLIAEFKQYIPGYCRIMRVQRDIPTYVTEAGVDRTNLRQYVEEEMKKRGIKCGCIRCREVGRAHKKLGKPIIRATHYKASKGIEFFISAESKGYVLGFCRLRFPSQFLRKEITHESALVRELHVYGEAVAIGKQGKVQHRGLGKELLKIAEDIAKTYYKKKMVIISGVGVRDYYRKLGYRREGVYMVKSF